MSSPTPESGISGRTTRRTLLAAGAAMAAGGALGVSGGVAPAAAQGNGPKSPQTLVGAIRWDGYTGGDTRIGMGGNRMLSPEKYHFRLPFYSDITVAQPILVNSDFDNDTTGSAPAGWSALAGASSSVTVVDAGDRAGRCVNLHDTSTTGMAVLSRTFTGQTRAITLRWDWKESVAGSWSRALLLGGSTTIMDVVTRPAADGTELAYRTTSGSWERVQTIAADTWYSLKIIVDPAPPEGAAPWVDIFVDGVRGAYHVPLLATVPVLDTLMFQTNPSLPDDLFLDNVSVEVTESVNIDSTTQAIMDQELHFASAAGIDYWAFDYYPQEPLGRGRELYLASQYNHLVNWCAILDGNFGYGAAFDANLKVLVARMAEPNYQRVQNGRPLVYFFTGATVGRANAIRAAATAAGLPNPYIVVMGWTAQGVGDLKTAVGADAVSRYATGALTADAPYSDLTALETSLWTDWAVAGGQVIPTVSTGWDPRDRYDYPPPWGVQPDTSYLGDDDIWTRQATPEQVGQHLGNAIHWTKTHSQWTEANAVLIYAWNENLEGGWICPTRDELRLSGRPLRLDAIATALQTA